MILQLQTDYLSRLDGGRYLKHKTKLLKLRMRKAARAQNRKLRSRSLAWYRSQYFLSHAYADMRGAISRNEDIFITMVIIAAILGYAYASLASQALFLFFGVAFAISEASGISMMLLSVMTAGVLLACLGWIAAFSLNALSLSVMHGSVRKQNRSVRSTLRQGLHATARRSMAWAMLAGTAFGPLLLIGVVALTYLQLGNADVQTALSIAPYVAFASVAWVVYILLQYGLVAQVAVFEPELSYKAVFSRSRQLLRRRGRLFLLALHIGFAAVLAALYGASYLVQLVLHLDQNLVFTIASFLALMFVNGIMTAFYRKRRLARIS